MTALALFGGILIGVVLGLSLYGWIISYSLSHGRLPKSLENIGFTLPERYKNLGTKKISPDKTQEG